MSVNDRPVDPERDGFQWANGLENVESFELVNELLRRGWEARERTRNGRKRTILLAPLESRT